MKIIKGEKKPRIVICVLTYCGVFRPFYFSYKNQCSVELWVMRCLETIYLWNMKGVLYPGALSSAPIQSFHSCCPLGPLCLSHPSFLTAKQASLTHPASQQSKPLSPILPHSKANIPPYFSPGMSSHSPIFTGRKYDGYKSFSFFTLWRIYWKFL